MTQNTLLGEEHINQSGTVELPGHPVPYTIVLTCAAALAAAGCNNSMQVFQNQNDGGWFSRPAFAKPDWAEASTGNVHLSLQGPVGAEDMVSADGSCAAPASAVAQTAESSAAATESPPPADRAVGSVAGDFAGTSMSPATSASAGPNQGLQRLEPASGPQVSGGIALGMTECQAVQRAGIPSDVAISASEKGERKVVLTYLSGPWPGIFTFTGGRLKVVERAPEQPKPAKAEPKKTLKKKPSANTTQREFERASVQ
jgi:hypothetical protein